MRIWNRRIARPACKGIAGAVLTLYLFQGAPSAAVVTAASPHTLQRSAQTMATGVDPTFDDHGVPLGTGSKGSKVHDAATVARYALAYAGKKNQVMLPEIAADEAKALACAEWLATNLAQTKGGALAWVPAGQKKDEVDTTTQALGVMALLEVARSANQVRFVEAAAKAARVFDQPLTAGGVKYQHDSDIWFESHPASPRPNHDLRSDLMVLVALHELEDATHDKQLALVISSAEATTLRWLPRFEGTAWMHADLMPRPQAVFRFANPFGFALPSTAVHGVVLRDSLATNQATPDRRVTPPPNVGAQLVGAGWANPGTVEGRAARRLIAQPEAGARPGAAAALVRITLPAWAADPNRDAPLDLEITYFDGSAPGNLALQLQSDRPAQAFVEVPDGDLLLSGASKWREWVVPVKTADLARSLDDKEMQDVVLLLACLSQWNQRFSTSARVAFGDAQLSRPFESVAHSALGPAVASSSPRQTPIIPVYTLDAKGVVQVHVDAPGVRFVNSQWDPTSSIGAPSYSPFVVSKQLLLGNKMPGIQDSPAVSTRIDLKLVHREPALHWLLDPANYRKIDDANVYLYPFPNVYNDVEMKAGWPSAFGQAYVISALEAAADDKLAPNLEPAILAAANAYKVPTSDGGIMVLDRMSLPYFEEVPNNTHVLNAELVSVEELCKAGTYLHHDDLNALALQSKRALNEHIHLYDAGYWLRYDQNPKKDVLLQLDWLNGVQSPEIELISLENPQTGVTVSVKVADSDAFQGPTRISGTEWTDISTLDGHTTRGFKNGYPLHAVELAGGTRHNVYLHLALPPANAADLFDVPTYRLNIHYKDVAPGRFVVKAQSINDANQLTFEPLRDGVWKLKGDKQWHDTSFLLRPSDLGWYKGPAYEIYETEQLKRVADTFHDTLIAQYAERAKYYLDAKATNLDPIIEPDTDERSAGPIALKVTSAVPTYPGHDFTLALSGKPNDNYAAALEGQSQY